MEEESKPYCHKFNKSQSNRLPVDCTSFQWETSFLASGLRLVRQWPKVLLWLDLLIAQAVAQDGLSVANARVFIP